MASMLGFCEYADQIGIDPAFTIHDREDSAHLVNLVRHELGFSRPAPPPDRDKIEASQRFAELRACFGKYLAQGSAYKGRCAGR